VIDGGLELDLEAVRQNIEEAEVVCLYFPTLGRTLLVDTRSNEHAGSHVSVQPMAPSSAERLRSLRRLRPQFPRPRSLTLIPWDGRVESLCSLGLWEPLLARLDCPDRAIECLRELRALERRELRAVITGEEYDALWSRLDCAGS
jgi:hypothetical protein